MSTAAAPGPIRSTIPARLDRLKWSPFHGDGSNPTALYVGYVIGGAIMVLGGIVELLIGIKAEGKSLEAVTKPLTSTADRPPPELPPAAVTPLVRGRGGMSGRL